MIFLAHFAFIQYKMILCDEKKEQETITMFSRKASNAERMSRVAAVVELSAEKCSSSRVQWIGTRAAWSQV